MNKTVLLACCDFLILATLALSSFKKAPDSSPESSLSPDNSFQVFEEENEDNELATAIFLEKINEAHEELYQTKEELNETKIELNNEKLLNRQKDNEISSLKLKIKGQSKSVYKAVLDNLWQVNVTMKEDDSFSPDFFNTSFFSCSFEVHDTTFIAADFKSLGFLWPELIKDGNISKLSLTLAKTGPNPWSTHSKGPVYSMSQDPSLCLIKVPKGKTNRPISILPYKQLPNYFEKMYAAKSDGRIIKIKNVSILPTSPQWISIDEERFLGHPDKVQKGDLILTSDGMLVGLITKEMAAGNKTRLLAHSFSKLDISESIKIPITKANSDIYFKDFVSQTRHISKSLLPEAK